jgi:hypothetical protein
MELAPAMDAKWFTFFPLSNMLTFLDSLVMKQWSNQLLINRSNKDSSTSLTWSERDAGIDPIKFLSDSTPYVNDITSSLPLVVFPNDPSYPLQGSRDGSELGTTEGTLLG